MNLCSCLPPTGLEGGLTYVLSQLAALITASTVRIKTLCVRSLAPLT
jgi:hypothetical protein